MVEGPEIGDILWQVQRVTDVSQPSTKQTGQMGKNGLLMLLLTDGKSRVELLDVDGKLATTKPVLGSKMKFSCFKGRHGYLTNSADATLLGGRVVGLGRAKELKEEFGGSDDRKETSKAPQFVPLSEMKRVAAVPEQQLKEQPQQQHNSASSKLHNNGGPKRNNKGKGRDQNSKGKAPRKDGDGPGKKNDGRPRSNKPRSDKPRADKPRQPSNRNNDGGASNGAGYRSSRTAGQVSSNK